MLAVSRDIDSFTPGYSVRSCSRCSRTIVAGGSTVDQQLFCGENCIRAYCIDQDGITDVVVTQECHKACGGACPQCKGSGPLAVYTGRVFWSAFIMQSDATVKRLCCRSCGRELQRNALVMCAAMGWWSLGGLFITPVMIFQNIAALCSQPNESFSSEEVREVVLESLVRASMKRRGFKPPESDLPI
jgi:hypothetical protein